MHREYQYDLKIRVNLLLIILTAVLISPQISSAQCRPEIHFPGGNIALSFDGNKHDLDDVGALPMSLAFIAAAGLQDKVVHVEHSIHPCSNDVSMHNKMKESANGVIERFGYSSSIIFDYFSDRDAATANFISAINNATESDPLWIIAAGPMESVWSALNGAEKDVLKYVHVVSHSQWNERHGADCGVNSHSWNEIFRLRLSDGLNMHEIIDQNGELNHADGGDFSTAHSEWTWLKNSNIEDLSWLYSRNQFTDKFDPSDCGMVYWLISGGPFCGNESAGANESKALLENPCSDYNDNRPPGLRIVGTGYKISTQAGDNLYLQAEANDVEGSVVAVELYVDGSLIRSIVTPPYEWGKGGTFTENELSDFSLGDHKLEIVAVDNEGFENRSKHILTVKQSECGADYIEKNGMIVIEAENMILSDLWTKDHIAGSSNDSCIIWKGKSYFKQPDEGIISAQFEIFSAGKYTFKMRTKVGLGNDNTEHNDTWVKFPEANEFYGVKNAHRIYPVGSAGLPFMDNGSATRMGYLKIFSSGSLDWTWNSLTYDEESYDVMVEFEKPGVYTVQLAARSDYHVIDQLILFRSTMSNPYAADVKETLCDAGPQSAPTVSLLSPSGDTTVQEGYELGVRIKASDLDGTVSQVKLYVDGTLIRQIMDTPYVWGAGTAFATELNDLPIGLHNILILATDDAANQSTVEFELTVTELFPGIELSPIHDAYLQEGERYNTSDLRVDAGKRVSYLMFDLSEIEGGVRNSELQLIVNTDPGRGVIDIYQGNSTEWTEENLSDANKPAQDIKLSTRSTTYSTHQKYTWSLDGLAANGKVSLIVVHTSGNDVSFGSKETTSAPKLIINKGQDATTSQNDKFFSERIKIYPNPSDGLLRIDLMDLIAASISIYNLEGRLVYHTVPAEQIVNISEGDLLVPGPYIIKVRDKADRVQTHKLLIVK
jgi:hypothetical protein